MNLPLNVAPRFAIAFSLLMAVLLSSLGRSAEADDKAVAQKKLQPNIVFFFVDDMGWNNLGYRNPELFETPNLDQLAKDGMDFQQAYVVTPACSPSRATMLTGKHPLRTGVVRHVPVGPKCPAFDKFGRTEERFNLWEKDPAQIPSLNWLELSEVTYAEKLKEFGYYNLFVGKWHLGHEPYHPVHQGFDRQIGTTNFGHVKSFKPPYFRHTDVLKDEKKQYLTDKLTDQTIEFIDGYDRDQPFMISMWYYNVHTPNVGRQDLVDHFEARGLRGRQAQYSAQVKAVDESVGRIRQSLVAKGIDDNTIIILTSDQGSFFELPPYRGCKRTDTLCEGGARVPLMVRWPRVTQPGCSNDSIVQTTDLFPTLVEIAGGSVADDNEIDGVSLVETLTSNKTLERGKPIFGYRAYEDLYASVRDGDWKLLAYRSGNRSLYNVVKDRSETTDLSESEPKKVKQLIEELKQFEIEMNVQQYSGVQ